MLILLISISYAGFRITRNEIVVKVDKNGDAEVTEKVSMLVETKGSIALYVSALENPTLADWQGMVGEEVRVHMDRNYVDIRDLNVRPQPLSNYNPLNEIAKGEIIIKYKVYHYKEKNDSGLFFVERIKPRTYRLKLNEKALSFKRSGAGNIIIDDKTKLTFIPPKGSKLIDINPIPKDLRDVELPTPVESITWNDVLLVVPSLVFEYEEGIGDEIYDYFEEEMNAVVEFAYTREGALTLIFIIIVLLFYAQLNAKLRKMREKQ